MPEDDPAALPGGAVGWAHWGRVSLALALVGAAAGAGLAWGNHEYVAATVPTTCGSGCVTDGSLYFSTDPLMRKVEKAIAQQNASVRSGGAYKTIVLLDPFTYSAGGTVSQSRMTDELAGALVAQEAVNKQAANKQAQRASPSGIQLLLANEGTSAEDGAAEAVAQIQALQGPDHITAVAGMGLSVAATQTTAMTLASNHLPMFGAVTTGDEFNGVNFPGFYQAIPEVEFQVQALLAAVKVPQDQRVALIYSDQPGDIYSAFLHVDFTDALKSEAMLTDLAFDPTSDPAAVGKAFANDTSSVCSKNGVPKSSPIGTKKDPRLVLFAGRAASLPALIQVLQQSVACNGQDVTILTGSDANDLPTSATLRSKIAGATVTVEYADIEDVTHLSRMFTHDYTQLVPDSTGSAAAPNASCLNQRYDPWAVATYDSVMAAATVQAPGTAAVGTTPVPAKKISGATVSWFAFTASGQLAALIKAIPLYQDSDGKCRHRKRGKLGGLPTRQRPSRARAPTRRSAARPRGSTVW